MRIVFFGATEMGYRCCRQLLETGEDIVGILSIPQEFRISYAPAPVRNVTFRDFADLAGRYDIPLLSVTGKMSDPQYVTTLKNWRPDFGLAIGWYYMIPRAVRELFPLGVAGIHASLLPKYRGGAPLVWAMINGERETGVTLFHFDDGVDTGDVIAQQAIEIEAHDTIKTLYEKATRASLEVLRRQIPLLREGTAPRVPQDHEAATQFPQRRPEDGLIDWSKSPDEIRNFIRAQTKPYPGAYTLINGKKIIIWDADVLDTPADALAGGAR
ncbi:MAG: methionyl-tRNA formyltransferase [Nitrospirota bacterium]